MRFPWNQPNDSDTTASTAVQTLPVAWWGRTSDEEQQDPTLSLPRQLHTSRDALPDGYVIVAHFYDVESGRLDLDKRGRGHAHEAFDIQIPRDGGIQDLLAEAKRPDRRFAAVICESVERVARRTYYGTRVEHELEQAGVMLLAADEPLPDLGPTRNGRARKRATPMLTRRVKQAIAEFQVLQLLELSWDGTAEHTEQGWNIGKPCYGYRAEKVPHPVAKKRAEGRSKTRLVPDEVEGPTVTRIYRLRVDQRLGYRSVADALNEDLVAHPPPSPPDPRRALGRWSASSVREILKNPKYTGYMVWNRRATTSKSGKLNPPSEWVWSSRPTHEPLVTKELFQAVTEQRRSRQESRSGNGTNSRTQTKRSYPLRSYVLCSLCDRRMYGKPRDRTTYYVCRPDQRQHADRRDWYHDHPKGVFVREDDLLSLTCDFFTNHVLGPRREEALRTPDRRASKPAPQPAVARLQTELKDLEKRRQNVLTQIEELEPTGDDAIDRDLRAQLRRRYVDLTREHQTKTERLVALADNSPARDGTDDPSILDHLPPPSPTDLAGVPPEHLRTLFDAFNLELRYQPADRAVTIRVTIKESRLREIHDAVARAVTCPNHTWPDGNHRSTRQGRDKGKRPYQVVGARGGSRTRMALGAREV